MEIKGLCKNEVRMVGMVCCPRFKVEPFYSKQKPIWSMVNSMSIATHNTKFWQGLYEDIQISPKQQTGEFFPQFVHLFGIPHSQCLLVTKKWMNSVQSLTQLTTSFLQCWFLNGTCPKHFQRIFCRWNLMSFGRMNYKPYTPRKSPPGFSLP